MAHRRLHIIIITIIETSQAAEAAHIKLKFATRYIGVWFSLISAACGCS
jgi:hypothetical protein